MSKQILTERKSFKYELSYINNDKDGIIENKYRDLANQLIEKYNYEVETLNNKYEEEIKIRKERLSLFLNNIIYEYVLCKKEINNTNHYWVERIAKVIDVLPEDEMKLYQVKEAIKTIQFIGFKIVNNVYIISRETPGNHIFFINGEVLTDEEVNDINNNIVPIRLINTKATF